MEFFERAHMKQNEAKHKKSKEKVKKQLKQMLYGYKTGDNILIKNAANIENDLDESESVSGFSDLNLTNSSLEDDPTRAESVAQRDSSLAHLSENFTSSDSISDHADDSLIQEEHLNDISSSVTIETVESLSEDISKEEEVKASSESDKSTVSEVMEFLPESEKSEVFDADGILAAKILKQIELKNNKNYRLKRKYRASDEYSTDKEDISNEFEMRNLTEDHILETSEEDSSLPLHSLASQEHCSDPVSPPYISITATGLPMQRLDDVIGGYKYSTVKNLPSGNQNISTNISDVFIEENMNIEIKNVEENNKDLSNLSTEVETEVDESISNMDNTSQSELISDVESPAVGNINLDKTFRFYYTHNTCILVMKHPSELFIQGKVKIKALGGTIELFGYKLKDDSYNLYAPYYNFSQSVKTVENPNVYYGLFRKLTSAGLTVAEAEAIVISIGDQDGVILLEPLNESKMDYLDNSFKVTNLFVRPNKIIEPYFKKASDILNCSFFSARPWKSFGLHPSWQDVNCYAQTERSRGIVCGGKGVGKSTYLRYQVNKLLENGPVLVVDLDPGQCEFTVAGSISATIVTTPLFGPSFTHLQKPEIILNIGLINVMENLQRYVSAVRSLLTQCQSNKALSNMPWVINTMGMTNMVGLKLTTLIIILLSPTYLLQYDSKKNNRRFVTILTSKNIKQLYNKYKRDRLFAETWYPYDLNYPLVVAKDIDKSVNSSFALRPKDERYLNFLAYFSQLINGENSLLGVVPYEVPLKEFYIAMNVIVREDCIKKVINGKVVALCQHARQCDSASAKVFTLSDKPLLCHGHGLIRGIDWEKEILYIITPVPSSELASVDTLLYADWVPELEEKQLPKGTVVPYRTVTQEDNKQLMSTPRRRFNPLQLLKMARST